MTPTPKENPMTQNDEGNMLAPVWLFDHVAACIRDGKATEEMAQNVECLRGGMEAQAARIAELEAANRGLVRLNEATQARAEAAEAALSEMTRRRDEWRKKAEGYDDVRLALREKVGTPWPPHMSRLLWAGIAADEKKRADDAEAEVARLQDHIEATAKATQKITMALTDEVARLRDALGDALDAWDTHCTSGDSMQGCWVRAARAAMKPKQEDA